MRKILSNYLRMGVNETIKIKIRHLQTQQQLQCKEGDNLMDVTNKSINKNVNVYGLCDKQLACTTCSVEILSHYSKLGEPSEEQLDVLMNLNSYKDNCTRMACQIKVGKDLQGMIVRIPTKIKQ